MFYLSENRPFVNLRHEQCDQIWQNSTTLSNIFKVYLVLSKVFRSLWHNLNIFGQIFITVNCQIFKKNVFNCNEWMTIFYFRLQLRRKGVRGDAVRERGGQEQDHGDVATGQVGHLEEGGEGDGPEDGQAGDQPRRRPQDCLAKLGWGRGDQECSGENKLGCFYTKNFDSIQGTVIS